MATINDLSDFESHTGLKFDDKGNILCRKCQKRQANITKWGMLRNCEECPDEKFTISTSFDDVARHGVR
jgi:hypothetical protein